MMNVLIIDDNEENIYLLQAMLKGSGYKVVSAADGAEALEKLRAEGADMIISDILMPVMDGFELCREVKADEELKDIPFVFYTATYTDGKDEDFALRLGADSYIRKPVEPDEFIRIIQGVVKDAERGSIAKKKPLLAEKEVFKLYSQRLVAKLERKMLALQAEVRERKRAEERAVHLSEVLRAIRGVNQLIVKEKDRDRLLKGACRNLVETRGYYNAWIALIDKSGKLVAAAEAGIGDDFLPLVERLKRGQLPHCAVRAQREPGAFTIEDPPSTCADCPLAGMYAARWGLACRLESAGNIYGLLVASTTPDYAADEEEQSLFGEVAKDIAFALHSIRLEQQHSRAQEELRLSSLQWQNTFDATEDMIAIINKDYRILRANRAMKEAFKGETVEGALCYELIHGTASPPETCMHHGVVETGEPGHRQIQEKHLGGRWLDISASGIKDETGTVQQVVHLIRDITERKRVEQRLSESELKHRTLVENLPQKVFWKDNNSVYVYCNQNFADDLGVTSEEFPGKTDYDFFPKELADKYRADDRRIMESGETEETEEDYIQDAEERTVRTIKTPVRNEAGNVIGIFGILWDITEQRQLEQQLRQAQKMEAVGRLAGGVAHDFNNLLTGIKGYAELMLDGLADDAPVRDDVDQIRQLADRAADLTRQLLAFSRRQTLEPVVLNMNGLISDTIKMLRRVIGEDIQLKFFPAADLGNVRADPAQVQQILMNLAVNARDAMPTGGELTVETGNVTLDQNYADAHVGVKRGPYVMLAVTDSGCGMDKATQERIFEPFFTTKEVGTGTGLGLATVYGSVKQHGGNIWVYSEPGRGTTFKIYLPRVEEAIYVADMVKEKASGGAETILLVEDEKAVLAVSLRTLEPLGYTVLSASCPDEAEQVLAQHGGEIDLLLTDVVMPGRSGRELHEALKSSRPSLKVLYMSGYTDNAIVHHGVLDPGKPFIQKPFSPDALARKVREVLDAGRE